MEAHQQQRPTPMVTFNKTSAGKTKPRLAVAVDGALLNCTEDPMAMATRMIYLQLQRYLLHAV